MQVSRIGFSNTNVSSMGKCFRNTPKPHYPQNAKYSKYSADNLKANYLVNFKGCMRAEASSTSGIGVLNHQTHLFREPKTDEIVQNYILDKFSDEPEVNVVSGACSTGEEAKSYAMMLDSLGDKLHVFGFDISDDVIEQSKDNVVHLLIKSDRTDDIRGLNSEKFLVDDDSALTPYQKKCKEKFMAYYDKSGETYRVPIEPGAQETVESLEALLKDKEKYEKAKNEYIEAGYEDIGMTFDEFISKTINNLKANAEAFDTFQDYKAKDGYFDNCQFEQGDLLNLENSYKPNSVNILLYRNALYHTLCEGYNQFRSMINDAEEIMDNIAGQMNKVVKEQGLVVFGENEETQGIDADVIKESMEKNGFKKLIQDGAELDNVWVKIRNID